jgi:hypothetical protein
MAVEMVNKYTVKNSLDIEVIRKDGIKENYGTVSDSSWSKNKEAIERLKMKLKKAYFFARRWAIRIGRKIKNG